MTIKNVKLASKVSLLGSSILAVLAGVLSFVSVSVALLFFALAFVGGLASVVLVNKVFLHDIRTIVRQEVKNPADFSSVADALEQTLAKVREDHSPLIRDLHLKTLEEVRIIQAQLSKLTR